MPCTPGQTNPRKDIPGGAKRKTLRLRVFLTCHREQFFGCQSFHLLRSMPLEQKVPTSQVPQASVMSYSCKASWGPSSAVSARS